jgi:hypothetical protein
MQDIDVAITNVRWTEWDYQGTVNPPVLACRVTMAPLDGSDEHEEFLSAGSLDNFTPNPDDDGKTLVSPNGREHLTQSSNWYQFIQSILDSGGDLTPLKDDVSILEGSKFHVVRKPAPKRDGAFTVQKKEGREAQILVVDKVISLPWDKKGAKRTAVAAKPAAAVAAGAAKANSGAAANSVTATAAAAQEAQAEAPAGDDDLGNVAIGVVTGLLEKGVTPLNQLKVFSFRELNKNKALDTKTKNAISAMITADWLAENGFVVDGTDISMPQ